MVAVFRVVARHEQKITDAEQVAAQQVGLDGDPVTVSCSDLDNGLDTAILQQMADRFGLDRHSSARRFGDVDCIDDVFERISLREEFRQVNALGRG